MNPAPERVLVVEDDPGVRELERRWLERAGYRVVTAANVEQAMERIQEMPDVALVVLDFKLPGERTGLDFQRLLRARGIDVPVIMVSGSTDEQTAIEALRLGIEDFVPKAGIEYIHHLPATVQSTLERARARGRKSTEVAPTILVVEDDAATAELERHMLERAGYPVRVVGGVKAALEAAAGGGYGLAVLDFRLQDGNGIEIHERLSDMGCDLPSILVTAWSDEGTVIRALRAGMRDFIPKGEGFLDELLARVTRVMAEVRHEQALRRSEERYRRILATANEGIWLLDAGARITYVNERMAGLLGYTPEEMAGRSAWDFAPPDDRPRLDEMFERRRAGISEQVDLRFRHRNGGDLWMILAGRPIHGERGAFEGALDMFTDVTDRRRAEDEVRRLNTELERRLEDLQKLLGQLRETDRRKDEFLAMLGHELRNPLAAITNAAQVLRLPGGGERELAWASDVIHRQAASLARMVDDLLDISRIDRGIVALRIERVELGTVVAQAIETGRAGIESRRQKLHLRLPTEPVVLEADPTRLVQVLSNLLSNANKFTGEEGEIWLEGEVARDQLVIRVRDSGIGIGPDMLPRVFDLFAQADQSYARSYGGLGVGLTLVQRLVSLHGGSVAAYSAGIGQGSEFVLRLPVTRGAVSADANHEAPRPRRSPALGILVVDDDLDVGNSTGMLLRLLGHRVRVANEGEAALAAARVDSPQVVLIDLGMSGMDGFALARRLRQEPAVSGAALVAVTGYGQPEDRQRTRAAGFDAHLVKPVTGSMLDELLGSLGARGPSPESSR